jgi:hypothetical protein
MRSLRLKIRLTKLLVFHSFIDDICYAVELLHCGMSLSESKLMNGIHACGFKSLLIFLSISFASTFEIIGSKLTGPSDETSIGFFPVWVSLLFVQSLIISASIRVAVWR